MLSEHGFFVFAVKGNTKIYPLLEPFRQSMTPDYTTL
jgi:hypothetical protein